MTRLVPKEVRDAAAVVCAVHELAARTAVPLLTAGHIEAMREANRRFGAATRAGDVDAAMDSDDELHGVLVGVCGNRAVAATIEPYTQPIRRLERRQFSSARARRSVQRHDGLIAACAAVADSNYAKAESLKTGSTIIPDGHDPARQTRI